MAKSQELKQIQTKILDILGSEAKAVPVLGHFLKYGYLNVADDANDTFKSVHISNN